MGLPTFVKIVGGMPVVDIGYMRHSITILQSGLASPPVYDASGVAQAWNVFLGGVQAAIGGQAAGGAKSGTDVIRGDQTGSQLYLSVVIWYIPGVTPNMRVQADNGSTYIIQSIENVLEMNVVLVLTCLGIGAND